jgi:polar amino acid transport system substrate-binding protein
MTLLAIAGKLLKHWVVAAIALFIAGEDAHAASNVKSLRILYFERPPFYYTSDGHFQGTLVAPVNAALDRLGISYVWQNVPAKRILEEIKQGGRICSPGWIKTPQRDSIAKFTRGFFESPKGYALVSENIQVADHSSLVGLLALVPNLFVKDGLSFSPFIDGLMNDLPPGRLHRTTFDNDMIARFVAEDGNGMMLVGDTELSYLMRPGLRAVALTDVFDAPPLRLMCSKDVSDNDMAQIENELPQLYERGGMFSLKLISEDYPPFNMRNETGAGFTGTSTVIVQNALKNIDIKYTINSMPWARALLTVRSEKDTCAFSVSRTPERENWFKWVATVAENKWVLFAKRSREIKLSSLEKAKPLVIGTYVGDAIEKFLLQNGFRIQATGLDELNLDKLENNRIDLWATGELVGEYYMSKHN